MEHSDRIAKLESDVAKLNARVFSREITAKIRDELHAKSKELMNSVADQSREIAENEKLDGKEKKKQISELERVTKEKMEKLNEEFNEEARLRH